MPDEEIDTATQLLIDKLVFEEFQDTIRPQENDRSGQLHEDGFSSSEDQDLEEALRLSRAEFERDTIRRVTGHDLPEAESSRAGAARGRDERGRDFERGSARNDHHPQHNRQPPHNRHLQRARPPPDTHPHTEPPNSGAALPAQHDTRRELPDGECVICADTFPITELIRPEDCPESDPPHYYCEDCLKMAFEGALRDESRFPVKCCPAAGRLQMKQVGLYFDNDFKEKFKHRELELKSRNRLYCYKPKCSAFIEPQNIKEDKGTCRQCRRHTCTRCKKRYHPGKDCPRNDKDVKKMLKLGKAKGWQKCPSCKEMADQLDGCNHMYCPCGSEYCYLCGAVWKTCPCPYHGTEHISPEEQDRRDAIAARRFQADEEAQWDIDRQFGAEMPPWLPQRLPINEPHGDRHGFNADFDRNERYILLRAAREQEDAHQADPPRGRAFRGMDSRGIVFREQAAREPGAEQVDSRGRNFRGMDFRGMDFRVREPRRTSPRGQDLLGGNFRGRDLREADFESAVFGGTGFEGDDLTDERPGMRDFREGNILGGNFRGGDFRGADFGDIVASQRDILAERTRRLREQERRQRRR